MSYNIKTMYLDYFNNFLTIERFAEWHNLSMNEANFIINEGRNENSSIVDITIKRNYPIY